MESKEKKHNCRRLNEIKNDKENEWKAKETKR